MSFKDLNLIEPILKAVEEEGYETPTPIQVQSIPIILTGRDLLGTAQTGTGKTAAFAIPILQRLVEKQRTERRTREIKTLVLTPTRELALQIEESFAAYGRHTGIKSTVVFGGVGQRSQTDALAKWPEVLIATPGRLLDLMQQGYIDLSKLEIFVLDEADRMLDMGFIHDVKKVQAKLPAKRQTLFFSATMPPEIVKLSDSMLINPARVEVAPVSSAAETVQQKIIFCEKPHKRSALVHLFKSGQFPIETALVFTRTKHGADKIARYLNKAGVKADAIHGDKAQNNRQKALANFKDKKLRALVATDIAARGIDIDELAFVVNYDLPNISETYVHRIGRTGRAGLNGTAISFCDTEERAFLKDIEKLIRRKIDITQLHSWSPPTDEELAETTGYSPADGPVKTGPRQPDGRPVQGQRGQNQPQNKGQNERRSQQNEQRIGQNGGQNQDQKGQNQQPQNDRRGGLNEKRGGQRNEQRDTQNDRRSGQNEQRGGQRNEQRDIQNDRRDAQNEQRGSQNQGQKPQNRPQSQQLKSENRNPKSLDESGKAALSRWASIMSASTLLEPKQNRSKPAGRPNDRPDFREKRDDQRPNNDRRDKKRRP